MTRDLVARVAMTLAVPAAMVGVDVLVGSGAVLRPASLAPLLWATGALGAVLVLGRERPKAAPRAVSADDVRDAA